MPIQADGRRFFVAVHHLGNPQLQVLTAVDVVGIGPKPMFLHTLLVQLIPAELLRVINVREIGHGGIAGTA